MEVHVRRQHPVPDWGYLTIASDPRAAGDGGLLDVPSFGPSLFLHDRLRTIHHSLRQFMQ
jgi:hypothetical protein